MNKNQSDNTTNNDELPLKRYMIATDNFQQQTEYFGPADFILAQEYKEYQRRQQQGNTAYIII